MLPDKIANAILAEAQKRRYSMGEKIFFFRGAVYMNYINSTNMENVKESNAYGFGFINATRILLNNQLAAAKRRPWYVLTKYFVVPAITRAIEKINDMPTVSERGWFYFENDGNAVAFHWNNSTR